MSPDDLALPFLERVCINRINFGRIFMYTICLKKVLVQDLDEHFLKKVLEKNEYSKEPKTKTYIVYSV